MATATKLNWMATLKQAAQIRTVPTSWLEEALPVKSWPAVLSSSSLQEEELSTSSVPVSSPSSMKTEEDTLFAMIPGSFDSEVPRSPLGTSRVSLETCETAPAFSPIPAFYLPSGSVSSSPASSSTFEDEAPHSKSKPRTKAKTGGKRSPLKTETGIVKKKHVSTKRKLTHLVGNGVMPSQESARPALPHFRETLSELRGFLHPELTSVLSRESDVKKNQKRQNPSAAVEVSNCAFVEEIDNSPVFLGDCLDLSSNEFEHLEFPEVAHQKDMTFEEMLQTEEFASDMWSLNEEVDFELF